MFWRLMHHLTVIFNDMFDRVCEKLLKTKKTRLRGLFFILFRCAYPCSRLSTFCFEALACASIAVEAFCSATMFNNIKMEEIELFRPDL
jgi:hypothetical protein